MLTCGLDIGEYGATLVILEPWSDRVANTFHLDAPVHRAPAKRWICEQAGRYAPESLWIAVADIKWHWLDDLGSLPVRWIHYLISALYPHLPSAQVVPVQTSRYAIALARALHADLNDIQAFHEEMFYLSHLQDCAKRLMEIVPRTRRFHAFLREHLKLSDTTPF